LIGIFALVIIALIFVRAYFPNQLPAGLRKNPAWLPPSLCTVKEAEAFDEGGNGNAVVGDADMGASEAWWQSPLAWGSGWFILMMLIVAVPNCQWGNLKYPKFDGRDHVGIGAWRTCSNVFESDQGWVPPRSECSQLDLQSCAGITGCNEGGFSERDGANELYEASWINCRTTCSPGVWESYCLSLGCGGSDHATQCSNVTEAVHQNYQVTYVATSGLAWAAGDRCRDVSEICDNGARLGHAGGLGWSAFAFVALAQALLIAYAMWFKKRDMRAVLVGSLASFALAWILLLASWVVFVDIVSSEATCTIVDASDTGAIIASGKFGDIIHAKGSYSFAFVVASWVLLTLVVGILSHRVFAVLSKSRSKSNAAEKGQMPAGGQTPPVEDQAPPADDLKAGAISKDDTKPSVFEL